MCLLKRMVCENNRVTALSRSNQASKWGLKLRTPRNLTYRHCFGTAISPHSKLDKNKEIFVSHPIYPSIAIGQGPFKLLNFMYRRIAASAAISTTFLIAGHTVSLESEREISVDELKKHNKPDDLWISANSRVYDLTEFQGIHPGGARILQKYAGCNASKIFNKYHAKDIPEKTLRPEKQLGVLKGNLEDAGDITEGGDSEKREEYRVNIPRLNDLFNLNDFEYIARHILSPAVWYYYSAAADDEVTYRENHNAYSRIFFKPYVCRDVSAVDLSTDMLGAKVTAPFYCSACAQAKLGHPDGEAGIARGCGKEGIAQMISNYASYPLSEIAGQVPGQVQWFQLYTSEDRQVSLDRIKEAERRGMRGIFITVDTPELGRREKDMKLRAEMDLEDDSEENKKLKENVPYGRAYPLTWDDVDLFKKSTKLPIALKGVQRADDIVRAAEHGVKAVVLSNHGGRQLDFSPAPIDVLAEAQPLLKKRQLNIEVYVDGGVRRGSDILKALALGAKGVGLGRPFMYANSGYGEAGARKVCQMLKEELILDMQLLGITSIADLTPDILDTRGLAYREPPFDAAFYRNYEKLGAPKFANEIMAGK